MLNVMTNCMVELSFKSQKKYISPFNEIELNAIFTASDGTTVTVPGFWDGDNIWKIRYSSIKTGVHKYITKCSDTNNTGLHNLSGEIKIVRHKGNNRLLQRGPLQVAAKRTYLEHSDGTPFFWLGDTWWMSLCKRLKWPQEFKLLVQDRVKKGFTLIQIVAGLYPDMPAFDKRGANEAGFPWDKKYNNINPAYFKMADRRIDFLVKSGLVPCIVSGWGYHLFWLGLDKMKKHWRYLIARYGAYPVVWCIAGETVMPYYLSTTKESDITKLRSGWTEITRYVRNINYNKHPVTTHPTDFGHNMLDDVSLLDIDMLQTGHGNYDSLKNTVSAVKKSVTRKPRMPVLVSEVNYEGILGSSWEDIQRFLFWSSMLSGTLGHTYGANGIWQLNKKNKPYGNSPWGGGWGDVPWTEAYKYPGSLQLGIGKKILEQYKWWEFEQHQEWTEPAADETNVRLPYSAGIPKTIRMIYFYCGAPKIKNIEQDITYKACYIDPKSGKKYNLGTVKPDEKGDWQPPVLPIAQDFLLILEK
jgi:hypothetical protein